MRHRMGCAAATGLGRKSGTDFCLWNNKEEVKSKAQYDLLYRMANDFGKQFLDSKYCPDFGIKKNWITIGVEPSYQWDYLRVIHFAPDDINKCLIEYGTAFGPYGTKVAFKQKFFSDYKRKNKYTRFINKWFKKVKAAFEEK